MAAERRGEKRTLNFSGNTRSYGTAGGYSGKPKATETIQHDVCEGDTLQGLALRYGVSVEDIRLENKLYANDSLFLRPHLSIPVSNRLQPQATASESLRSSPSDEVQKGKKRKSVTPSPRGTPSPVTTEAAASNASSSSTLSTAATKRPIGELDKSSAASFLASFDQQLSVAKSSVLDFQSTVDERCSELGAAANAEADAAAANYADKSRWEQKGRGRSLTHTGIGSAPPPSTASSTSPLSLASVRRLLPGNRGQGVSKTDERRQAQLEAQNEDLFGL